LEEAKEEMSFNTVAGLMSLAIAIGAAGCTGSNGTNGNNGTNGQPCTVAANADGSSTITCPDGTTSTIPPGQALPPGSCTVTQLTASTKQIECTDGSSVTVTDGLGILISDIHGLSALAAADLASSGKYMANMGITSATAAASGTLTVKFTVQDQSGNPVSGLGSTLSYTVAKLVAPATGESFNKWVPYIWTTETAGVAGSSTGVPIGSPFAGLAGNMAPQPSRESKGTLTENPSGTYTYIYQTKLGTTQIPAYAGTNTTGTLPAGVPIVAATSATTVTYDRSATHRVSVMLGGHAGPTATATFDFVPDGSTATQTRDIITTATCQQCHGPTFAAHGGDRLTVENCTTCHAPGGYDAQSGASLDLKVMVHRIHSGGSLAFAGGSDAVLWGTAANELDNTNIQWGYQNSENDWWKIGFPAGGIPASTEGIPMNSNCQKCHQNPSPSVSLANVDNWRAVPSRAACGSCHEDVYFGSATNPPVNHPTKQLTDSACSGCHGAYDGTQPFAPNGNIAVTDSHDWLTRTLTGNTSSASAAYDPTADRRYKPEFNVSATMTAPANGSFYAPNEAPIIYVSLTDPANGNAAIDCSGTNCFRITGVGCSSPMGCSQPLTTTSQTGGSLGFQGLVSSQYPLGSSSLQINGPRAMRVPQLTSAARAATYAHDANNNLLQGPFVLTGVTSFALIVDGTNGAGVPANETTTVYLPSPVTGVDTAYGSVVTVAMPAAWVSATAKPYGVSASVICNGNVYTTSTGTPAGVTTGGANTNCATATTAQWSDGVVTWTYIEPWTAASVSASTLETFLNNPIANPAFVARAVAFHDNVDSVYTTGVPGSSAIRFGVRSLNQVQPHSIQANWAPSWAPATAYKAGAFVINDSNVYRVTVAGTSAPTGSTGPTCGSILPVGQTCLDGTVTWATLGSLPQWTPGAAYVIGNIVVNSTGIYQATTAGTAGGTAGAAAPTGGAACTLGAPCLDGTGGVSWAFLYAAPATDLGTVLFNGDLSAHMGGTGSAASNSLARIAPWAASTAYIAGQIVYNDTNPPKYYTVGTAGTSAASVGPTGSAFTGTPAGTITDGTVKWKYSGSLWQGWDPLAVTNPAAVGSNTYQFSYQLDPIQPSTPAGTYTIFMMVSAVGNGPHGSIPFQAPSTLLKTFNVGVANEPPVARNCSSCHEAPDAASPGSIAVGSTVVGNGYGTTQDGEASQANFRGMVFSAEGDVKMFSDLAADQCGACHDYALSTTNATYTGTEASPAGTVMKSAYGGMPISHRVHAVHKGSALEFPNLTVGASDEPTARNWDIMFPGAGGDITTNIRRCEACHVAGNDVNGNPATSAGWYTLPNRVACTGCHDDLAAQAHMAQMTFDPTPAYPFSGDELESCNVCHAP